jgi:hypothetical protein
MGADMQDMNRVMLGLIASLFGIAGITLIGLSTLFLFIDVTDEQHLVSWFGIGWPSQMWQTGGIFMIVCLLAFIASILAFPDTSSEVMDDGEYE